MPRSQPIDYLVGNWHLRAQCLSPRRVHFITHCLNVSQHRKLASNPLDSDPLVVLSFPSNPHDTQLAVHRSRLSVAAGPLFDAIAPSPSEPGRLHILLDPADSPTIFRVLIDFLYCADINLSQFSLHQCALIAETANRYLLHDLCDGFLAYIRLQNLLVLSDNIFEYVNLSQLRTTDESFKRYYHTIGTRLLTELPLASAVKALAILYKASEQNLPASYTNHIMSEDVLSTPEALLTYLPVLQISPPPIDPFRIYLTARFAEHYKQVTVLLGQSLSEHINLTTLQGMWAILVSSTLADPILQKICSTVEEIHTPHLLELILKHIAPSVSDDTLSKFISYVPVSPWHRRDLLLSDIFVDMSPRALRVTAAALCTASASEAYFSLPVYVIPQAPSSDFRAQDCTVLEALDLTVQHVQSKNDGVGVHIIGKKESCQHSKNTERRVRYFIQVLTGNCQCGTKNTFEKDSPLEEVGADLMPGRDDFEIQIGLLASEDCQKWHNVHGKKCSILLAIHIVIQRLPVQNSVAVSDGDEIMT